MVATFYGDRNTTFTSYYCPTNVSEEAELTAIDNEPSSLFRSIPKHNRLIIDGDINAQIGKNVSRNFSLHNSSNRNGKHVTDFTLENSFPFLFWNLVLRHVNLWAGTDANNA